MASITIRNLDDSVKLKLKARATVNRRSMEQEARTILTDAFERGENSILNEGAVSYKTQRMQKIASSVSEEEIAHYRKIAEEKGVYASIRSIVDKYGGFDDFELPPRIAVPFRNPFDEWTDEDS
jgi:plasmid stability protein